MENLLGSNRVRHRGPFEWTIWAVVVIALAYEARKLTSHPASLANPSGSVLSSPVSSNGAVALGLGQGLKENPSNPFFSPFSPLPLDYAGGGTEPEMARVLQGTNGYQGPFPAGPVTSAPWPLPLDSKLSQP